MADCTCDNLTVGSNGLKINSGLAEPPASDTPWQVFKGTEFANLLRNGSFESWTAGTSSPPDGWTHTAPYGTVARDGTTVKTGTYSAKVGRGASVADAMRIRHTLAWDNYYRGKTITFGAWVWTDTANNARLSLYDGVGGYTYSSYHTGGSSWEYLTVSKTLDAAASMLLTDFCVNVASTFGYFDGATLTEGPVALAFAPKPLNDTDAQTAYGQTSFMSNVGINTPTPASRLHMKTVGDGFWSPLTIEAESASGGTPPGSQPAHSANALEFKRSRGPNVSAENDDDCGNFFFSCLDKQPEKQWREMASIDSRVRTVPTTPPPPQGQEGTGDGELTFNVVYRGHKQERMRIHANGYVTIGEAPSPNEPAANLLVRSLTHAFIEARAGVGYSPQFRLYEGTTHRWSMHCQTGSDWLRWSDSIGPQMYLTTAGNLHIKGSYLFFSPVPPKENMTPDDYLDWALEDAKKPRKPYAEMPDSMEEVAKYGKDLSKIAIGTVRYVEHLREQIKTLEARLARLEGA